MPSSDAIASRLHGFGCVLVLLCAVAICRPIAETGICDDWSYVLTAERLAQTGHVVYNGWATAMLGWQLLPAAVLIRVFGPSFFVARITTLVVGLLTTFGIHRCLARSGIRSWNADLATLSIVLSPLFLPLVTTFMSDVFGFFPVVVCLYCCLRAIEESERSASRWLIVAAVAGVIGGTARQISWLGLLVMVPSTGWALLGRKRVLATVSTCWAIGCLAIAACWYWFRNQPFAVPETFAHSRLSLASTELGLENYARFGLEIGMLLLPLLLGFLSLTGRSRRSALLSTAAVGAAGFGAFLMHHSVHSLGQFLVPTLLDGGNFVGVEGVITATPEHGLRPRLLSDPLRATLTLAVILTVACVLVAGIKRARAGMGARHPEDLRWQPFLKVVLPFTIAYLLLLAPRAMFSLKGASNSDAPPSHPYDRYSLPLLLPLALVLAKLHQEQVSERLSPSGFVWMLIVGSYGVATTHDAFAMYRGTQDAVVRLEATGVPAAEIDAGWEFDGWTQVQEGGFVHDPRLRTLLPANPNTGSDTRPCHFPMQYLFPKVHPTYSLAFEPTLCGGAVPMPPTVYRTWLPSRTQTVYVVKDAPVVQ